jgi:hypothetical protein
MGVRSGHIAMGTLVLLGACGGLENPDLTVGAVSGHVGNAAASGGYVYVLNAPSQKAAIAADGSYTVGGVPVGSQQLVVVAASGGVARAELAPVDVSPGMLSQAPDRDAASMAPAGRIVVAARPDGYSRGSSARYTVNGTIHQNVPGSAAVLGDLPAGTWTLTTTLRGFHTRTNQVTVSAGADSPADESLDVDDDDDERGCLAATCSGDLHCNGSDGRCYACLDGSHCLASEHCDTASHTCVSDAPGAGLCEAATSADQCASAILVTPASGPGYCSLACPGGHDSECPAGWSCVGSPGQCQVVESCIATTATFGSACAMTSTCAGALAAAKCLRPSEEEAGFCTAACTLDQQCMDAGFGTCQSGYCRP